RPFSRLNLPTMASRSSGSPATAVYLVRPRAIAAFAAARMLSGVSKSGSPDETATMSRPSAFSRRARSDAKLVGDGLMRDSAAERKGKERLSCSLQLDVLGFDQLAPLGALLHKILREFLGRARDQDQARLQQRLGHLRQLERSLDRGTEPLNGGVWRSGRH